MSSNLDELRRRREARKRNQPDTAPSGRRPGGAIGRPKRLDLPPQLSNGSTAEGPVGSTGRSSRESSRRAQSRFGRPNPNRPVNTTGNDGDTDASQASTISARSDHDGGSAPPRSDSFDSDDSESTINRGDNENGDAVDASRASDTASLVSNKLLMEHKFAAGSVVTSIEKGRSIVANSSAIEADMARRWSEMGVLDANDGAVQFREQGFFDSKSSERGVMVRNLRLESRLHKEIEEHVKRDAEIRDDAPSTTDPVPRTGSRSNDVFAQSAVKQLSYPMSLVRQRTVRSCEGDNVTSFLHPPATQRPIPIHFERAPKDIRFRSTEPAWLTIIIERLCLVDHPLFSTEDYIAAQLHRCYEVYLDCMREDRLDFIARRMQQLMVTVASKKKEVDTYSLHDHSAGRQLHNLCITLVDTASNFIEEFQRAHILTSEVYRLWSDLKRVREKTGVTSTSIRIIVKQIESNPLHAAVVDSLGKLAELVTEMQPHLEASGIGGVPSMVAKLNSTVDTLLGVLKAQSVRRDVLLTLRADVVRTSDGESDPTESKRRRKIDRTKIWAKIVVNGQVICQSQKRSLVYPGFYSDFKHSTSIRLNKMPDSVRLELWCSGSLFGGTKISSMPLELPAPGNAAFSLTSVAPIKFKYAFSDDKPMPPSIAARVNFDIMTAQGATKSKMTREKRVKKKKKQGERAADDSPSSSSEEEDIDETDENTPLANGFRNFVATPRERFISGETLVTTGWMTNDYLLENNSNRDSMFAMDRPASSNNDAVTGMHGDGLQHPSQEKHPLISAANTLPLRAVSTGNTVEKILFPGPNQDWFRNNFLGNNSRIIGGPIHTNQHGKSSQSKSISIVEGGEFFDEDVLAVFSRMPHVDPNDPRNATVMAIRNQTKRSVSLGDHFRTDDIGGDEVAFGSANPTRYAPTKRKLLLQHRHAKPLVFGKVGGNRPLPLTDEEITKDPFFKALVAQVEADARAQQKGMNHERMRSRSLNEDIDESELYLAELLHRQRARIESFRERITRAQHVISNTKGRRRGGGGGLEAYVREFIKPDFAVNLNLSKLFARKRQLRPSARKREEVSRPKYCKIRVHVINASNVPVRFDEFSSVQAGENLVTSIPSSPARRNRQRLRAGGAARSLQRKGGVSGSDAEDGDDDNDEEFAEADFDGVASLTSFVSVNFQGREYRTNSRQGSFPQWNEPLDLTFVPHGRDGNTFTPRNLASIGDPIKISLFDEKIIQNETERRYRQGVSYRQERRYLGGISLPFSTVYMNQTVHGALPLTKPVLTLGYRAHGQLVDGENLSPLKEQSRCDTVLRVTVSIEPPLPREKGQGQVNLVKASGESPAIRKICVNFLRSIGLGKSDDDRNIQICASDISGYSTLVCRFISPQPCPEEVIKPGGNLPIADAIQSIVHYVGDGWRLSMFFCSLYMIHPPTDSNTNFFYLENALNTGCRSQ